MQRNILDHIRKKSTTKSNKNNAVILYKHDTTQKNTKEPFLPLSMKKTSTHIYMLKE